MENLLKELKQLIEKWEGQTQADEAQGETDVKEEAQQVEQAVSETATSTDTTVAPPQETTPEVPAEPKA